MKLCRDCGKELADNVKFCDSCGAAQDDNIIVSSETLTDEEATANDNVTNIDNGENSHSKDKEKTDPAEMIGGCIVWAIIIFVVYWYWHCADGIRAIKNMNVTDVVCEDLKNKYGMEMLTKGALKNMSYNTSISFEEALKRTAARNISFEKSSIKFREYKIDTDKSINISMRYDPPYLNKYSVINIIYAVQKNWFFHFNPNPIQPIYIIAYDKEGKQYKIGGKDAIIFVMNLYRD